MLLIHSGPSLLPLHVSSDASSLKYSTRPQIHLRVSPPRPHLGSEDLLVTENHPLQLFRNTAHLPNPLHVHYLSTPTPKKCWSHPRSDLRPSNVQAGNKAHNRARRPCQFCRRSSQLLRSRMLSMPKPTQAETQLKTR